ncbi:MAG: GspE/PulE family protein [Acidobacteriota bacterium]|nr:GspE/PulE family protein [Acidobacteriota bacterium]
MIPKEKAFELKVIPLFLVGHQLTVALHDPYNLAKLGELRFLTGKEILPVLALESDIERHLTHYYGEMAEDAEELCGLEFEAMEENEDSDLALNVEGEEEDRPVIRLVNLIIARAIQERASDIHLEPQQDKMQVRYRIDGSLQPKPYVLADAAVPALISRVKILARIDIAEKRMPQDGKIRIRYRGRNIDVRVSTFPSIHGEKVVLRLLDKEQQNFTLETVDMSDSILTAWKSVLNRRQGIVLVTGPTGSGKSSTLYATLRHLHRSDVNIVTLEDPVEYELPGVTQAQVQPAVGFTFAKGLRSILRQDPDIILVGEIRDEETAHIAVQAAQTGHLVLASLHTNDALSAITRLLDMGLPRYLISASLVAVLAQRLVRRLCSHCAHPVEPTEDERLYLGPWIERESLPYLAGAGCDRCMGIGYRGRIGVHELVSIGPHMRRLIAQGAADDALEAMAAEEGFRRLWWDGLEKVRARLTSLRELARQADPDHAALENDTASRSTSRSPGETDHAEVLHTP